MTFDEIFQQYVAQGFTKPMSGVSGIETLMPTTATVAPIVPIQQPNDRDNIIDTTSTYDPNIGKNFYDYEADAYGIGPTISGGISNLITQMGKFPTPLNLAKMGIQGIGNLINNINDPYKTFTGALKPDVQEAIQKDIVREMARENERSGGGGYSAGYDGGFMGGSGTSADMGSF
jgi:hypothetical protein